MMNRFLLLLLLAACGNGLSAQMNVTLHMAQKLGDQPFSYELAAQAETGYAFNVTRLQYYVSEIKLVHDGGQVTPVTDLYLLIDPAVDSEFELGSFDVTDLEQIQFSIGVDAAHNHLDPASYPNGHPLAPQNPSMQWGWTAGYRFIAFEGYAGADSTSLNNNYQIHTIGDANYFPVTLDVNGVLDGDHMAVHIQADYTHLLHEVNAGSGIISHAATGASKKIAQNARDLVFTATVTSGTVEAGVVGTFQISPNPASGVVVVKYDFPGFERLTLAVNDLAGRKISTQELSGAAQSFSLATDWQPGVYIARIFSGDKFLALEKLVVK